LSRSTLLYYDRIGLLHPSGRTEAGYRVYSQADADRLETIGRYRSVGLPLSAIARVLDDAHGLGAALVARLRVLDEDMRRLQEQQRMLFRMLGPRGDFAAQTSMTKKRFVETLRIAGVTDEQMDRWHAVFERTDPEAHQRFLEFLGIPEKEIAKIRALGCG